MQRISLSVLLATVCLAHATEAHADRRIFAFTYPYMTPPEGTFEVEHYLDLGLSNWDNPATPDVIERNWAHPAWQHQVEFEYGITDRLDFALYNVLKQDPYGTLKHDGVKVRSRYRFADPGGHAVDTAVYAEVKYFGDEVEIEQKLILSKTLGRVEIAFNATLEQGYEIAEGEWEYKLKPSLGIGYHLSPGFALTAEYVGRLQMEEAEIEYFASHLGPGLSVASGPFYWTLSAGWQLGKRSDLAAIQARSLFGIVF